ncbi:MAG: PQQ-binding-like beta-propeller repeat protein, partial [Thermoguttaceae bacterium]
RQCGAKLVDDLAQIKMVWVSEEHELGMGRAGTEGFHRLKYKGITPGTSTGLILAEGKVFASSSVPSGTVWAETFGIQGLVPGNGAKNAKKQNVTSEQIEAAKLNSRIDADDFTVAIDMKTGKTVWKSVEAGKGINVYPGKRSDMHNTPVYYKGKIFSLGTTGLVYCYDAATGKKLWEDNTGSDVKPMAALKAKCLQDRKLPGGMGKMINPVVAGGVLVMPQYGKGGEIPLRGMDVATGRTLWETADGVTGHEATPAVWTYQNKQYLVVANAKGELRMIDPRDGKVLWTVTGIEPTTYALTTSEKHVFVNVKSKEFDDGFPRTRRCWGRLGAYRITPEKAEFDWATPDTAPFWYENHKDICSMRRLVVRDGKVYLGTQRNPHPNNRLHIIDENTGEVLATKDGPATPQMWAIEDRLLMIPNPSHRQEAKIQFWTMDPKDFRQIGADYWPEHARADAGQLAAGYDVNIELPYANGFFFMRGYRGTVVCYDLRKTPAMLTTGMNTGTNLFSEWEKE